LKRGFKTANPKGTGKGMKKATIKTQGGNTMNRLGISIQISLTDNKDDLAPSYPLLASAYSRFGFLRLAGASKCGRRATR
jgi:hypothetical protein